MRRIKAKPTKHCGTQFRSKTEAMYCELFNRFDEPWTYEPTRFYLPSGSYLPDFFLSRLDLWLEVKGKYPTNHEIELCRDLSIMVKKSVVIAYGWPPTAIYISEGRMHSLFMIGIKQNKLSMSLTSEKIPEEMIHGIQDKFKKRVRTPKPKKR